MRVQHPLILRADLTNDHPLAVDVDMMMGARAASANIIIEVGVMTLMVGGGSPSGPTSLSFPRHCERCVATGIIKNNRVIITSHTTTL
jgi:hypothetical protein